jgi:hypothetical protein
VILRPTWSISLGVNPHIGLVPSQDAAWEDNAKLIEMVKSAGLEPILYPGLHASGLVNTADLSENWWNIWFSHYEKYLNNFSDLAEQNHIGVLIIGGPEISQFLPDGKFARDEPNSVPEDISLRWFSLLAGIRERYHGKILWAMEFPDDLKTPPAWLDKADGIYVLWSTRLTKNESYDMQLLTKNLSSQFDKSVKPLVDTYGLPVYIAAGYPSAEGVVQACIKAAENSCYDFSLFESPAPELDNVRVSEEQQSDIYHAFFEVINSRGWVSGFFSRGYNLKVELQDPSMSVRSKSAEDLLWYWFSRVR